VGIPLCDEDGPRRRFQANRVEVRLALLPKTVRNRSRSTMTSQAAYVWTWLPGDSQPVAAGRLIILLDLGLSRVVFARLA
jgi:hypothetical protein